MRIGFVTCVQLGLACMEEIYAAGGHLDFAMTLRDDRAAAKSGRVFIDAFCGERGIPLAKIVNINDPDAVAAIREADLDWLFIIGWSQIARGEVLAAPRKGVLGMHPTLLPEGRGRAAIPWAILKGLKETGVTLFKLDEGVDTGPILAQERLAIGEREDAGSLYARVNEAHRLLVRHAWPDLVADRLALQPQDPEAGSVWPGRKPEDGRLDPGMAVAEVDRLVRAVTRPYPGAFLDEGGRRLRIWKGAPATDGGAGLRLAFADGAFLALDHAWETLPE